MMLSLCLALTTHYLPGEWNDFHPCVRYEADGIIAGWYLNSEGDGSFYLGKEWEKGNWFLEGGIVTGYEGATIAPYGRAGLRLRDGLYLFVVPAVTTSGEIGAAIGIEVRTNE